MTSDDLKKLLEDSIYQKTSHVESIGRGMYISGYEYAVKLLWPLVEALNDIEGEWRKHSKLDAFILKNAGRDFCGDCNAWVYDGEKTTARQALEKVEQISGSDE